MGFQITFQQYGGPEGTALPVNVSPQIQKYHCKQKQISLQTKQYHCKHKNITANKRKKDNANKMSRTLQTKIPNTRKLNQIRTLQTRNQNTRKLNQIRTLQTKAKTPARPEREEAWELKV